MWTGHPNHVHELASHKEYFGSSAPKHRCHASSRPHRYQRYVARFDSPTRSHHALLDRVEFWSHHEKVVVVDNHYACIGGLDLCFGRWDTHSHPLADVHPTEFFRTIFPGQDYNNARIMDFQNVPDYASNALSVLDSARMPWHDVHMTLTGPVVLDIVQHFVERWNEIKKRKVRLLSCRFLDWTDVSLSV